mmetsp:Transcript_10002/g.12357  ORF Transcript_10002/g.12357 Transcript_10002/m.12357 type:complete len:198 (-) Transcript_10002:208-801(-)
MSIDHFKCAVCLDVVRDCVTCSRCFGLFCAMCVLAKVSSCPKCRCPTPSFQRNHAVERIIETLDVECTDCHGRTLLSERRNHDLECPEALTKCFFNFIGCEWEGKRKMLEKHLMGSHSPNCPMGHPLYVVKIDDDVANCDICNVAIFSQQLSRECIECDFDLCQGCFTSQSFMSLVKGSNKRRRMEHGTGTERIIFK